MKTKTMISTLTFTILCLSVIGLLAGCSSGETPVPESSPSPHPAELTAAVLETENAALSTQLAELNQPTPLPPSATPTQAPSRTPSPTISPTPGPTIAVPEGVEVVQHAAAPGYVFVFDPEEWQVENAEDPATNFLVNQNIRDCTVNIAPEESPGELLQYYPRIIGRQGWLVEGYEETTFYIHEDLKLELSTPEDDDCILAQAIILADVLTEDEFNGAPARTPAVQPTERPTPEGFTCEGALPSRLRVGDRVLIVAGTLWLRSEPRVDEETEIRFFQQYTPVEIILTGGPECADESIFWEVSVSELAEGGQTFTGWMAENNTDLYFLDIWYLGW
jgi:hypothetical protein